MSDIVNKLQAYPDDPAAVMTRAMLNEAIDEIVRLRAELAAERERHTKTHYALDAANSIKRGDDETQRQLYEINARIAKERDAALASVAKLREALVKAMQYIGPTIYKDGPRDEDVAKCNALEDECRAVLAETGGVDEQG